MAENVNQFFEENWPWFVLALITLSIIIGLIFAKRQIQSRRCTSTVQLVGKTVIVTGSNIGIGKETARNLYRRGARVILACRNVEKANEAARDIESTPDSRGTVVVRHLDLANINSIREFAKNILIKESRVDILINNAGLLAPKAVTVDGFDLVFQTNHLGHFLLTNFLLDKIKASAPSRIINVSSMGHYNGTMHWNDLNMNNGGAYTPWKAYTQSKLANILFTKELAQRLQDTGVTVYALHPGVVRTAIWRYSPDYMPAFLRGILAVMDKFLFRTTEQGAQTTIHCAACEKVKNQTGLYYDNCRTTTPSRKARNEVFAKKLWQESAEMVKLDDELSAFKIIINREYGLNRFVKSS